VKSFSFLDFLIAAKVSPPPAIEINFPCWVNSEMAIDISFVPFAKLSFSKKPNGPFQKQF